MLYHSRIYQQKAARITMSLLSIFVIFFSCLFISGCGTDKYVSLVKQGSLNSHPNVPIGEAFDQFFSYPKWESLETKDKRRIVRVSGNCMYNDREAKLTVNFLITGESTFELRSCSINFSPQPPLKRNAIVAQILDEYNPKK